MPLSSGQVLSLIHISFFRNCFLLVTTAQNSAYFTKSPYGDIIIASTGKHNIFPKKFLGGFITVSYTHLDVYKRQPYRRQWFSSNLPHYRFLLNTHGQRPECPDSSFADMRFDNAWHLRLLLPKYQIKARLRKQIPRQTDCEKFLDVYKRQPFAFLIRIVFFCPTVIVTLFLDSAIFLLAAWPETSCNGVIRETAKDILNNPAKTFACFFCI